MLSHAKRIGFAHFGLGPQRRAQTVFAAHATYSREETKNPILKSAIEVTFRDQGIVKTLAFKAPRGRRCQKFTPPYVIEQCFQLGIVNRGVRPNFVKHGVPLRRCLGSGAFYRYHTLQPNFSLRWAVERGFAYDRTTKIKSEICKHLCLRLQLVAFLKMDSRACLTLSLVQAIRLTP